MVDITQTEDTKFLDKSRGLESMLDDTKLLNFAKLAKILLDLFGFDKPFQKVGKREGREAEFYFPALNGYLTFVLVKNRMNFEPRGGKSKNPTVSITIKVKREKTIEMLSNIVRTKNSWGGILNLFFKYVVTRKIKINGWAYITAIKLFRCLAIGKHEMYEVERENKK